MAAKRLRSVKLEDDVWDAMGSFAAAEGIDRTKLIERWAASLVPREHWREQEPLEGQTSIYDAVCDE